ncbi:MAG TPA: DNA repair protein RecO [Mesorhizobium sp.]
MEWRDEGIILGVRRHGETSVIVEAMTRDHGRHLGLVRGGRSRKQQPILQVGNRVDIVWRARLDEHLGNFLIEPLESHGARLMASAVGVFGVQTLASHLRLLPERDPHGGLYSALVAVLDNFDDARAAGELLVRFELLVLDELGFGLELSRCAATGAREELVYVSPKSGQAVSREAGQPWRDKMLALPEFLLREARLDADLVAIEEGTRLTAFFFRRHVYEPRGISETESRAAFLNAVRRALAIAKITDGETAA